MESGAAAFDALFKRNYRVLLRFIYFRVNDRELAEDLTGDTFRIAWEKHRAGVQITTPPWLFAAARNVIGNEYRRRDRERSRVTVATLEALVQVENWGAWVDDADIRLSMSKLRAADA